MNIIISGFKPFGDYLANSSELVVRRLVKNGIGDFHIVPMIFDATIPAENRGEILVQLARDLNATGIISLGMASEKKGLCFEESATNAVNNMKYCPPELQGTSVDMSDDHGARIVLDLAPWNLRSFSIACREKRIPWERSFDAGGFCCNHLAYQTRSAIIAHRQHMPFVFIHLPCCSEAISDQKEFEKMEKISMTVESMCRGIELLIQNASL